jgi:AcrR family transcriptional regulator
MPPRTDPNQTRQLILEAALRCFSRKGYLRTSMGDIVAESGLSKGTLYWHFENKNALFVELFDRVFNELLASVRIEIDEDLSTVDYLRQLSRSIGKAIAENRELTELPINLMAEIWQVEEFAKRYSKMIEEFAGQFQVLLEKGAAEGEFRDMDFDKATWSLMAAFDGLALYYMAGLMPDIEAHFEALTDLFLNGVCKRD